MNRYDDHAKPSRIKRRWREQPQQGLTLRGILPDNRLAINALVAGRGNPFYCKGVKAPRFLAAFLCPSFRQAASRAYSVMAGCFGQRSALAVPLRGFSTPLQPVAHAVESMTGGYSLSSKGVTA